MCGGKTYIIAYLKECLIRKLSDQEMKEDDKFFEEFCKKYTIDLKTINTFIYTK